MKKNRNLIIYIFFCLMFLIINILFLFNKMPHDITFEFNRRVKYILLGIVLFIEFILCFLVYLMYKKKVSLEKMFLMVAIPLGLLFLILIPVGQIPDEHSHFARTYEMSMGYLMTEKTGRDLPQEVTLSLTSDKGSGNYSKIIENIQKKNSGNIWHYVFINTAVYNFVCYTPQTIGVLIGKIFHAPILLDAYLGRLTNFICWLVLIYLAIKYIPFAKKQLILIINIQQAISLSPDALTYSAVVFLIAYTLHLAYTKKEIFKKDYLILSILCIVVSLCKIVYMPVCLILFIIPKEKFKNLKDKNIKIISLALVVVIINLLWLKVASGFLAETNSGVNPDLQKTWILTHPFSYIKVIIYSIRSNYKFYLSSMMGQSLELLNVNVSPFYPAMAFIGLIILTILDRFTNSILKVKDKILIIGIFASVMLLIFTSLYIQWTPLKANIIDGVQGRYILPILCLVPLMFLKRKENKYDLNFNNLNIYVLAYCVFSNLCALMYIFEVNF